KSEKKESESLVAKDIKYGYKTEFVIILNKALNVKAEQDFKNFLEAMGDSVVMMPSDGNIKVHIHTNDPGLIIQRGLKLGILDEISVENLKIDSSGKNSSDKEEIKEKTEAVKPEEMKEYGFIAVSVGFGMSEIFKSIGTDVIIEGGQTMNPSTEDMMNAIDKVNAKHIFILPNNKNIIMAANQARDLTEDKEVIVIPTKTVPQGISAMINFMPDSSVSDNTDSMTEGANNVKTGQVTYAVRDTEIDNKVIQKDDYMGIGDKGILSVGRDRDIVTKEMIEDMVDEDTSVITIYVGAEVEEKDYNVLKSELEEKYEDVEVEIQLGGQPIYYYIVSVE
ncbi:MAG: DAK2 domain-containing protein, partial [Lachnospiraceae bacterium]|nr:DAK2 domain-containing protein [Lachnospiraceae bacterium]